MPYNNSDLQNNLLPTISQIKKYLKYANDQKNRDPRKLMSLLQRLMEVDGHLFGLILKRKAGAKSLNWGIRLPLEFKMTPTEETQLAETKARFRRSGMRDILEDIVDGVLYGMSSVRLVWDNTHLGTMVVSKDTIDLTDLDFDGNSNDGLVEIIQQSNGDIIKKEIDPDMHLIIRHNPLKNRKNFVGSYMRTAMLLSYLKYHTKWDWRDLNKRHGVPATYAKYPEHMSEDTEKKSELISMVEKLKNDAVAVFPEWVNILYDEALKTASTDSFDKFIAAANTELSILFHGQNLTTEVKGGSFAASKTHKDESKLIVVGDDITMIEKILTQQYLKQDYIFNYGEPRNDYFEFYNVVEEQQDCESNSRIITNLFSDPEVRKQIPLKKDEVYQKLGFTKPTEQDEIV